MSETKRLFKSAQAYLCEVIASAGLLFSVLYKFSGKNNIYSPVDIFAFAAAFFSFYLIFSRAQKKSNQLQRLIAVSFALAIAIFSMEISGGISSPLLVYVFSLLICLPLKLNPVASLIYSLMVLSIIGAQTLSGNVEQASFIAKMLIVFVPIFTVEAFSASLLYKKEEKLPEQFEELSLHEEKKDVLDKIWDLLDFLREAQNISDELTLITNYLRYLELSLNCSEITIAFRPQKKVVYYELLDEEVKAEELNAFFNFDSVKSQKEVLVSADRNFQLLSETNLSSLYIPETEDLNSADYEIAKIGAEIFLSRFNELHVNANKSELYQEILNLSELSETLTKERDEKELFEKAASVIRNFSQVEKAVIAFCSPEKNSLIEDKTQWIIKGRYIKHPEEFWAEDFLSLAKECISNNSSGIKEVSKGNSFIMAAPVIQNGACYAVIAAITSHRKEEVSELLRFLEIIAYLLSYSSSSLRLLRSLDEEYKKDARTHFALKIRHFLLVNLAEILFQLDKASTTAKKVLSNSSLKKLAGFISKLIKGVLVEFSSTQQLESNLIFESFLSNASHIFENENITLNYRINVFSFVPAQIQTAVFEMLILLLLNAYIHSGSKSVQVSIEEEDSMLLIKVIDNGAGFNPSEVVRMVKNNPDRFTGLRKISSTIKNLNGSMKIRSAPKKGTEVELKIPLS